MEKKGLSAVVGTILIILLVIVAVGIIWAVVGGLFRGSADEISTGQFLIDLEIKSASLSGTEVSISVERKSGAGTLSGIKFVFSDGVSSEGADETTSMDELDQESFSFDIDDLGVPEAYEVSIAPIYESASGADVLGNIVDRAEFREATDAGEEPPENGNGCVPDCTDRVCGPDPVCEESCPPGCEDPLFPTCGADGQCYADECIPDGLQCDGLNCGDVYDSCGTLVICPPGCVGGEECIENICTEMTYLKSGIIDNVWPPGSGIYFDDNELNKTDGLYYGYAAFFPIREPNQCFLIMGYTYDGTVYANAIVELALTEPLAIDINDAYEIWESVADCQSAHGL